MAKFLVGLRRNWVIVPVLVVVVAAVGGLTYLTGTLGTTGAPVSHISTQIIPVAPPLRGTPVALYAQVDPAVMEYLEFRPLNYEPPAIDSLGVVVQPIGAYLPRTGNTQFILDSDPTPIPTPLTYVTATPLPLPYVERSPTPTPTLNPTQATFVEPNAPETLPYTPGDDECAPSGNPATGVLTQRFHRYHGGIDIGVPLGTPVLATHSGKITFAGWSDIGYGYLVVVENGAFATYYAHNTSFNVSAGQYVGKGSIIAWSGSTGNSSGPHIHYETRINNVPVDPLTFESRGYASC
jgi:hypothetical protein